MITVYISIGNSDDKLSQSHWAAYAGLVQGAVRRAAAIVHGEWASLPWSALSPEDYGRLREKCGLGPVIDGEVVEPRPAAEFRVVPTMADNELLIVSHDGKGGVLDVVRVVGIGEADHAA